MCFLYTRPGNGIVQLVIVIFRDSLFLRRDRCHFTAALHDTSYRYALQLMHIPPYKIKLFLAHLSRRLIGELIGPVRRPSVVHRRPQCSKIFFSKTAWPIKAKFYVELPWVRGTNVCSRHVGHMTKMVATPKYGKNLQKSSSPDLAGQFS